MASSSTADTALRPNCYDRCSRRRVLRFASALRSQIFGGRVFSDLRRSKKLSRTNCATARVCSSP
jgi:hypothetical protein